MGHGRALWPLSGFLTLPTPSVYFQTHGGIGAGGGGRGADAKL